MENLDYKKLIEELHKDQEFREFVALYLDKAINYKVAAIRRDVQIEAKKAIGQITENVMNVDNILKQAEERSVSLRSNINVNLDNLRLELRKEVEKMAEYVYKAVQKKLENIIK